MKKAVKKAVKKAAKKAAKARPVDFFLNDDDLEAAILGEAGWHTSAIAKETHLTESQVAYRLSKAGVKRSDYRNGKSEIAHFVLGVLKTKIREKARIDAVRQIPAKIGNLQDKYCSAANNYKRR